MRAVTRLCSYSNQLVAMFLCTWLPQALRITILTLFVVLNRCGHAYARYRYKAMIKKKGMKFVYGRKNFFSRSSVSSSSVQPTLECAICLSKFVDGEVGRELEKCKHKFHASCVEKWLVHGEGHATCPLCRLPVIVPAEGDVGEHWKDEREGRLCFEEDLALLLLCGLQNSCPAYGIYSD